MSNNIGVLKNIEDHLKEISEKISRKDARNIKEDITDISADIKEINRRLISIQNSIIESRKNKEHVDYMLILKISNHEGLLIGYYEDSLFKQIAVITSKGKVIINEKENYERWLWSKTRDVDQSIIKWRDYKYRLHTRETINETIIELVNVDLNNRILSIKPFRAAVYCEDPNIQKYIDKTVKLF